MKTIVAIHGNPGHVDDWNEVKKFLSSDIQFITVDGYDPKLSERLQSIPGPFVLVGYSLGAYGALKNLPSLIDKVQSLVLVTPYLKSKNPLSGLAKTLLGTPIVGGLLIDSTRKKNRHLTFLEEMIHPFKKESHHYYETFRNRLEGTDLWEKTIFRKINFENNPLKLPRDYTLPVDIIWGDKDKISSSTEQRVGLSNLKNIKETHLSDAGHSLLWSHSKQVADIIASHLKEGSNKIGYFPGKDARNNVINYLESHIKLFPERTALKWAKRGGVEAWDKTLQGKIEHEQVNYIQLAQRISAFGNGLRKIGVQEGDRIIIFLPMSLDMYVAMFAVQRIGAIAVFLDSWARSHHLGATANCVSPKGMVSFKKAFDLVDQVPEFATMPLRIMYGPGENKSHSFEELFFPGECMIAPVESETTALITFTTGSTGTPKGANRTHRFLSAQHHALNHVIPYEAKDIDLPAFPIFSLNNLATGVTTILPGLNLAAPSDLDPVILANQIINEDVNCSTLSPSMLVGLTNYCLSQNIKLSKIKRLVTGGAPISRDNVEEFYKVAPQAELWILYGSTEAEPMAHIEGRYMMKDKKNADAEIVEEGVNVGHISDDIDYKFIRLIDGPVSLTSEGWKSIEVPKGEVGEFICTGDHVCKDYYNNRPAFTATKIQDTDGRVFHRTGDLGYIDSEKNLWIVGRTNNAIERGGKYYFPVKSEIILKRLDFTYCCAFFGLPDGKLGQKTCVAIELASHIEKESFSFEKAKTDIRRIFEKNKTPLDEIFFVKSIPMDPRHHSKVEYIVLKKNLNEPGEILG